MLECLQDGADVNAPGHCGATPIMTAIETKHQAIFDLLLERGADIERTNDFNWTPVRFAVMVDWPAAVQRLIDLGVDLGRHPRDPLKKVDLPIGPMFASLPMPEELKGALSPQEWEESLGQIDDEMEAMAQEPRSVIDDAQSVEVLKLLLAAGEDLADAPADVRRDYIGLPSEAPLEIDRAAYEKDRGPRFGTSNPQRIDAPFWEAMIRCGGNAYVAREKFDDKDYGSPVWCYDRFGHSLTELPDGRFVGIAGEHEDAYDPDFCIYNDVIVHDGRGGVSIFGYPRDVFPPTDFHSATLVGNDIVVIGSLGYPEDRKVGQTPVYRLNLDTMAYSCVTTTGDAPGWISHHRARLDSSRNTIRIERGQVWTHDDEGDPTLLPNDGVFELDLIDQTWQRVAMV